MDDKISLSGSDEQLATRKEDDTSDGIAEMKMGMVVATTEVRQRMITRI